MKMISDIKESLLPAILAATTIGMGATIAGAFGADQDMRNIHSIKFDKVEYLKMPGGYKTILLTDEKEHRAHFSKIHGGPLGDLWSEDKNGGQHFVLSSTLVEAARKKYPGYKVSTNPCFPVCAKIMHRDIEIVGGNGFWSQWGYSEDWTLGGKDIQFLDVEMDHQVYGSRYTIWGWLTWVFTLLILMSSKFRDIKRKLKEKRLPTRHYVAILFGSEKGCGRAPEVLEVLQNINEYESAYSYSDEYIKERIGAHCSEFTPPLGIYRISTKGESVKQNESSHWVWGDLIFKGILREI
jgi:hypothetical protein